MLVLGREQGQSLVIYNDVLFVEVMVTSVVGSKVKLGVTAPRNITVDRREVFERKQRNTQSKEVI